ncbi:putative RNA recognition motif domain-containing protein [Lupinus albus]|uniref:Putative RNA recognition motif domain-containing protein n=1 Tax=Lupinus albus TaxID=3870 RepID=A0A6A4QGA9_LUPAL|nr:putative RNA recognition motif domain-containing protein [Lupinus albus]
MKTKNLISKSHQQQEEEGPEYVQIKKKTKKNKKIMKVLEEEEDEAELIDSEEDPVIDSTTTPTIAESKPISESKKSKLNKKRLLKEAEKADKRGVCYLSRIPPHMDHVNLRQILSQYADIQRIFLAPKDSSAQLPSKPSRRSQNTAFTEGWVEFTNKRVAKRVAEMLNGEQMGGKKRSSFHYDLWNIKYLSKFKWDDLTDELAFKKAVRDQKLALELSAAKRERDFYMSRVDQSHALNAIEERLKKKQKVDQNAGQMKKVIRHFHQTKPIAANAKESKPAVSDDLLDAVFGGS